MIFPFSSWNSNGLNPLSVAITYFLLSVLLSVFQFSAGATFLFPQPAKDIPTTNVSNSAVNFFILKVSLSNIFYIDICILYHIFKLKSILFLCIRKIFDFFVDFDLKKGYNCTIKQSRNKCVK